MKRRDDPNQLTFPVFIPPVVERRGDEFIVKAGRPLVEMSATQLGSVFDVDADTVYLWRQDGTIPEQFVRRAGKRKLKFSAEVITHLQTLFKKLHE